MAIKYKTVARKNPGDQTAPPKYYAQAVSSGKTTLRQMAKIISDISTVSSIDTMAALEAFLHTIPQEMADGRIVKLGDFGSFSVTISSEGVENEADFTVSKIKKYSVRFRPGKLFKEAIDNAGYQKE